MPKIGMISLGCPKNQVDAERMLAKLTAAGYELTAQEQEADVIIVNTCGFIESAKTEAIENILEAAEYKKTGCLKALIVTGCLAERYKDDILTQMPEVDCVLGLGCMEQLPKTVAELLQKTAGRSLYAEKTQLPLTGKRILTTPPYTAYLKVAEGCDNCCTYCAIPSIRGRFRSVPLEDCVKEAEELAANGVKELVVVAQDTTNYGADLYGEPRLCELLKRLCKIPGLHWVRTLYTYPDRITDELLALMRQDPRLVRYLDIPIQHCNAGILKRMNRTGNRQQLQALMQKIRAAVPGVTLRTTLITGFPGEDDAAFTELCEFVRAVQFDRLGCFAYSAEEGTAAATMPNQVPQQLRQDRAENIMNDQMTISAQKNQQKIGTEQEVLVEGYDSYIKCYYGRSAADAPDIDGKVFFHSNRQLSPGSFVTVCINDVIEYDLLGELKEDEGCEPAE